ncbi:hypothetical protein M8C21_011489, partial [Ambrosia artemisiifolia]
MFTDIIANSSMKFRDLRSNMRISCFVIMFIVCGIDFCGHQWIRNNGSEVKAPLDISMLRLMKAYMRSFALCKGALRALSKTLTVDELFYLKEQFSLELNKNG